MYVAVKGGEAAIDNAHRLLAEARRGDPAVPELGVGADPRADAPRRRPGDDRGLALRSRPRRARPQAGARRRDRGGVPAARLPHHPAALRRHRAGRHRRDGRVAARLGDLQGPAGRPGARPDLRLHPSPARFRAGRPRAPLPRAGRARPSRRPMPHAARGSPTSWAHAGLSSPRPRTRRAVGDLTREPLDYPADRDVRLQTLARGDEGFLLALGYSTQRGYGRTHPFVGEVRFGAVAVEFVPEELGFAVELGAVERDRVPDGQPVHGSGEAAAVHARLWPRLRPGRAQGDGDGAGRPRAARRRVRRGGRRRRRRTRNSCSPTATTSRRRASSST